MADSVAPVVPVEVRGERHPLDLALAGEKGFDLATDVGDRAADTGERRLRLV